MAVVAVRRTQVVPLANTLLLYLWLHLKPGGAYCLRLDHTQDQWVAAEEP